MSLVDGATWQGQVLAGEWTPGARSAPVIEPATGDELATLGLASVEQVAAAADIAARAQREWAARPYFERAAVLQKAAALVGEHAQEISDWIVRESGATRLKAGIEVHGATGEHLTRAHLESGLGRVGGRAANLDAFTETQWVTVKDQVGPYPF